jgi:hypothetical protein
MILDVSHGASDSHTERLGLTVQATTVCGELNARRFEGREAHLQSVKSSQSSRTLAKKPSDSG